MTKINICIIIFILFSHSLDNNIGIWHKELVMSTLTGNLIIGDKVSESFIICIFYSKFINFSIFIFFLIDNVSFLFLKVSMGVVAVTQPDLIMFFLCCHQFWLICYKKYTPFLYLPFFHWEKLIKLVTSLVLSPTLLAFIGNLLICFFVIFKPPTSFLIRK